MASTGMVPVFYHKDIETAKQVLKACYDGGVRVFEFTNRGDRAHEVFARLVEWSETECPEMAIGAGSIVDAPTAALYIGLGACFIVSPMLNTDIATVCNRRLIPYCPGCGTPTETGLAHQAGCDITKLFPGEVYGPRMVKAIKAPMPWTRMMITGGVSPDEDNLREWFGAGAFCVGMGSKLFPKERVESHDWSYITEKCRESLDIIARLRPTVS